MCLTVSPTLRCDTRRESPSATRLVRWRAIPMSRSGLLTGWSATGVAAGRRRPTAESPLVNESGRLGSDFPEPFSRAENSPGAPAIPAAFLNHLLDPLADLGGGDAAVGHFAVDGGDVGKLLSPDLAAFHQLFEHRSDVMLGIADQGNIVFGDDSEQGASGLFELHAVARDAFLENLHLVVARDELPVDRVNPDEIGELLPVAPRSHHVRARISLLVNRHDPFRSYLPKANPEAAKESKAK